ncbi:uncharacterized protein LOC122304715 [Carya illinoinensis]|uniref:uncharacterized protein LOC122304715 n=1 Tax=Carya illinoinensis TaxID=32201 RepID=UPI001C72871D|nr:uncharacterized protein LOC122304715 [Carya illinoinensis]
MALEMNVFNACKMPSVCDDSNMHTVDMVYDFDVSKLLSVFDSESASEDGFPEQFEALFETIPTSLELTESDGQLTETTGSLQLSDVSYMNNWCRAVFEALDLPGAMKSSEEEISILELKPLPENLKCEEKNLLLNWEKCQFMVTSGLVLGHLVSEHGIEVDRGKIELISQLPIPKIVKDIRSFLSHAGFYRRFIQGFSSIAKPLYTLLQNDTTFVWTDECQHAFETLRKY